MASEVDAVDAGLFPVWFPVVLEVQVSAERSGERLPCGAVTPRADFMSSAPLAPALNELTVTADGGYFGDMLPPVFWE